MAENGLDAAGIVSSRIAKLEPIHATKILGYMFLHVAGDQDISLLACASDEFLQEIVSVAKATLRLSLAPSSPPISPGSNPRQVSNPLQLRQVLSPYQQLCSKQQLDCVAPFGYMEPQCQQQSQYFPFDDQVEKVAFGEMKFPIEYHYAKDMDRHMSRRGFNRRCSNFSEYPTKTCQYFSRGFCKHGSSCRYLHDQASPDRFSPMLGNFFNDGAHEDQFLSGSLDTLEDEIVEILKSRRGNPLSIASLPMIYYDRYGRVLQAEGYLTESQRQGKAGHSLTRLLSRLGSIKLIDSRPHGQHAVILAEDAMKYLDGRNDGILINSKSKQIYLTFPAESTFTEEDVSKYFSTYGPVQDVRIPSQHKRMFGFVTFVDPETVQMILAKGNPHYVCGARVLVKPYKEKSKLIDRKYHERMQSFLDIDSGLQPMTRASEASRYLLYHPQLVEEQQQAFELDKRRLAQQQLMRRHYQQDPDYLLESMNGLNICEDHSNVTLANHFGNKMDAAMNGENGKLRLKENISPDQESDVLNLPESPFASSIINSITSLIN